ncbi:MAG: hypothetical protein ABJ275_11160 [Maricaulaceae bacterium]
MSRKTPPITDDNVVQIVFYKSDELTTDLICCDITINSATGPLVWFLHEEADEWEDVLLEMKALPEFDVDWFVKVACPAFSENRTIAFGEKI